MTPLVVTGSKRPLNNDDLYALRDDCLSSSLMPLWEKEWHKEKIRQKKKNDLSKKNEPASIAKPFARTRTKMIIRITLCRLLSDIIHYVNPMLLKELIEFISQTTGSISYGIGLALLMFISAEVRSFLLNYQVYGMFRLTINFNTILTSEVLRKTLRLSPKSRTGLTSGEILNLTAVDIEKITSCVQLLQNIWSIPFQITLAMTMLWIIIGPAAIPGILILLLFVPLNYYSSIYIKKAQLKQMKVKDERTKMCSEVISGLSIIKLHAWEEQFEERIRLLREKEVEYLKYINYAGRMVDVANASAPFLVAMTSFTSFVWIYGANELTPAVAFVSLAIFNQIRQPMRILGMLSNFLVQSMVSNKRVKNFLNLEELDKNAVDSDARGHAVVMSNAFLNWEGPSVPASLKKIDLLIDPGQIVAVVGQVGSGKSSLLNAIMGELHKCSGTIHVDGTVAYVPQQPWIFNKTLRENILYGEVYDRVKYKEIIRACELHTDFNQFARGDQTEVGGEGVNLSGGQKARIELARALYQNRSIYLLDDPLSAVDSNVGRAIFKNALGDQGYLANTTRVLVTHNLQYTKNVDHIFVMFDGSIVQSGTYETLRNAPGLFADLLRETQEDVNDEEAEEKNERKRLISRSESVATDASEKGPKLIQSEKMEQGRIKTGVYWLYFKSMGLINSFGFFGFFLLHYTFMILRSIWLSEWSTENIKNKSDSNDTVIPTPERLAVYAGLGLCEVIMVTVCFIFLVCGTLKSATYLHNPMMSAILRSPMQFFAATPAGRILNRLTKDMEIIDNLGNNLRQFTQSILHVIMIFFLCSYSIPAFTFFAIPLFASYLVIIKYFFPTIRQLRRLESVNRSPILSIMSETISGASSIRAYGRSSSTNAKMEVAVDQLIQSRYLSISTNRWCAARLELLGNTVVLSAAVLGTISSRYFGLSPGMVGLSVSFALNITEVLNMAVRLLGELETNIVSVERVKEYHMLPSEADWIVKEAVGDNWPHNGAVSLNDIKFSYREDLPLVLKGISVKINSGEKVAIVGRTGSGKSTLTLALFRMVELNEGSIEIDGVNLSGLGLHQIRGRMAIIPQHPTLFSGTLRFNLDPCNHYSDDLVWSAIRRCQLYDFVCSNPDKLNLSVAERGNNMSVGERQLVCLGRALLQGGKLVVFDEATSAVDLATDALIQKIVREEFAEATVLTIAHRLDTIADYDKIMVIDYGKLVEYDSPQKLLENPQSIYSQMVENFSKY
ncbi:unnamed protein product [Auanema sp. JU1783]|nr:unnamed protein product [Auanema sp. JU1783]